MTIVVSLAGGPDPAALPPPRSKLLDGMGVDAGLGDADDGTTTGDGGVVTGGGIVEGGGEIVALASGIGGVWLVVVVDGDLLQVASSTTINPIRTTSAMISNTIWRRRRPAGRGSGVDP